MKPAKGLFSGPETAVPEADFPEPKGRKLRRTRREGKAVPPDAWVVDANDGACDGGGPPPEGVLFGGTKPKWGADKELGRELLRVEFRAVFGEKRGI